MEAQLPVAGRVEASHPRRWLWRALLVLALLLGAGVLTLMWWWDVEPPSHDVVAVAQSGAKARGERVVEGTVTSDALAQMARLLVDKRGGYLSNDVLPPGVFMDNSPNWEFGVLVQCRDMARALRNSFSRSQTQSLEDKDLQEAEPLLSFTNDRWMFPSSEGQYREAIVLIESYRSRLQDSDNQDAQFYARADNLADYLSVVEA